ncbi:MAG TPA: wax ester/triacylglycerol synthase family O-acyltransferase, partial [Nocardioidaceae bacterium]|nr:wax ester/triacylglycerol synthase family O-acyltransferase [Nocardioidaceae bacterium]
GGELEFGELVSALHTERLDWRRPLWECHLIEGLEGDRFALYFKGHHALMDGVGGVQRYTQMVTPHPDETALRPLWTVGPSTESAVAEPQAKANRLRTVRGLLAARRDMKRNAKRPADPATAAPYAVPRTAMNGRLSEQRRIATQTFDLARIKTVAKAAGVTVNDVFVTIVAGGLRRYLTEHGELPAQSLTAGTPVNVRAAGDDSTGNAFSMVLVKMFTDIADPVERVKAVARSSTIAKDDIRSRPKEVAANYGALIGGAFVGNQLTGLAGRRPPPYNVTVSCIPGPAAPFYLAGARLEGIYPLACIYHGATFFVASVTISGSFGVGFVGCPDTVPHVQRLAVYTGDALAELETALGVPHGRGPDRHRSITCQ